jgi:hypothetical protein
MAKQTFRLVHAEARRRALAAVTEAPEGHVVQISEPTRNLSQNAFLWLILTAFSKQLQWPVNGKFTALSPDEWKHILSAAFRKENARLAMGLDGGVVMLGMQTSKMSKAQFAEFLEFVQSVAVDRGVDLG